MKDRANWLLPAAGLVLVLLLGLSGPATAEESATALAAASPTPAVKEAPIVDKADVVIPNANHYKCYPIRESTEFKPRNVVLKDQFWLTAAVVLRPRYLCNPVRKTADNVTYSPPQPDAHLVCYEIREDEPTPRWEAQTTDQFGTLNIIGDSAELLCLPAAKLVLTPPQG